MLRGSWNDLAMFDNLVDNDLPVILVAGSGGLADLIIEVLEDESDDDTKIAKYLTKKHFQEYMELVSEFDLDNVEKFEKFIEETQELYRKCIQKHKNKCIFIWHSDQNEFSGILVKSLLENDEKTERKISRIALLNIALFCGSVEHAKDLYEVSNFNHDEMCDALMKALLLGKPEFVKLSTEFHFDFSSFLSVERLHELYRKTIHRDRVDNICSAIGAKLNVNAVPVGIPWVNYEEKEWKREFLQGICTLERGLSFDDDYLTYRENEKVKKIKDNLLSAKFLPYPMQELLLWSIAINEPSLTRLFLVRCEFGLQDRLMCATMYKKYSKILNLDGTVVSTEIVENLLETKKLFLADALDILSVADTMSQPKAGILVRRECPRWGHLSVMEIASKGHHLRMFEHSVFQRTISRIWRGQIDWNRTNWIAYYISLFPIIGWILLPLFEQMHCITFVTNNAFKTVKGIVKNTQKNNEKYFVLYYIC